jgi:hypothetical protein
VNSLALLAGAGGLLAGLTYNSKFLGSDRAKWALSVTLTGLLVTVSKQAVGYVEVEETAFVEASEGIQTTPVPAWAELLALVLFLVPLLGAIRILLTAGPRRF